MMNRPSSTVLTAGVLGGMGPDATVGFMARLLELTPADTDQDHIPLLVDQNPRVPSRHEAIVNGGPSPAPTLVAMAQRLQQAGADFLVMPCNTVFAFADAVREAVDIPLISIVEATLDQCRDHAAVGLMATQACLHAGVYQRACAALDRALSLPTDDEIETFMTLLAAIKRGDKGQDVSERMAGLANALADRGATAVIMGCTEIPLVLNQDQVTVPLVSSTDALARETVAIARGDRPLP